MKCLHNFWRKIVFWVGDIRKIKHFPWVTWDVCEHEISIEEAVEATKLIKTGDIGVHLDRGYLSNFAIPGFMKHAFYFTNKETTIEAISEGVVKRHALYPIISDYTIILRPKNLNDEELLKAVIKAENIVGQQYDVKFAFDIEEEVKIFGGNEIVSARENVAHWDGGFSCTEVVTFVYAHVKDKLRLYRIKSRGKDVVIADQFINNGFEVVWCSKSVTPEFAKQRGLHEEGIELIQKYWDSKKELF